MAPTKGKARGSSKSLNEEYPINYLCSAINDDHWIEDEKKKYPSPQKENAKSTPCLNSESEQTI